jgi:hypothetical protein
MNQQPTISSTGVRKLCLLLAMLSVLILSAAADETIDTRFNDLGNRVMCGCKTQQEPGSVP